MTVRRGWLSRETSIGLGAVLLLGALAYSNTLSVPFVFDDSQNIVEDSAIRMTTLDLASLRRAAFESAGSNRPIATMTFALNYFFGGYEVPGYHAVNLVIHLLNGILVFLLARTLLREAFPEDRRDVVDLAAVVASALFVLHPLQTQSVTYIVQRMNSLATLFYLSSVLLYFAARRTSISSLRAWCGAGCAAAAVLAIGSKEIAATLPIALLLVEWYWFRDLRIAGVSQEESVGNVMVRSLLAMIIGRKKGMSQRGELLVDHGGHTSWLEDPVALPQRPHEIGSMVKGRVEGDVIQARVAEGQ